VKRGDSCGRCGSPSPVWNAPRSPTPQFPIGFG